MPKERVYCPSLFLSQIPSCKPAFHQSFLLALQLLAALSHESFFSLANDVKQIPNVIFSADARKLEEVYYSSVRYSFQRKLLVRSIYLALCTSLILTGGLL